MSLSPEQIAARLTEPNPFATRFTRPGALPYLAASPESLAVLVRRLRDANWQGEIVGPHGSGKSTLLEALLPLLTDQGRVLRRFQQRGGDSQLALEPGEPATWTSDTLVMVDGYEQLGRTARNQLHRAVRDTGCGLLVTSHSPTGLPLLLQTEPTLELVQQIVATLQSVVPVRVQPRDVAASFARLGGNVREILFELFDLYERRRA